MEPRLRIYPLSISPALLAAKCKRLTLVAVPLDANMVVDDHDLHMAVALLLARVNRAAHVFRCVPVRAEVVLVLRLELLEHLGHHDLVRTALHRELLALEAICQFH